MGSSSSKAQLGVRAETAERKYEHALKVRDSRFESLPTSTLQGAVAQIVECFGSYSSFTDDTLMLAIKVEPQKVEHCILKTVKAVLSGKIDDEKWKWLQQFVLPSSIWMLRTADNGGYLWESMLKIAQDLSEPIKGEMDNIWGDLRNNKVSWNKVKTIGNQTFVSRQDDQKVGLLRDHKILQVLEMEEKGAEDDGVEKNKQFVDGSLAVSALCAVAKEIDAEFQQEMKRVMDQYGDQIKAGPIKTVDRCQSKLENDYKVFSEILEIAGRIFKITKKF